MTSIIKKTGSTTYAQSVDKLWTHDRSNTLGASEVGQCARKIFWLKSRERQCPSCG